MLERQKIVDNEEYVLTTALVKMHKANMEHYVALNQLSRAAEFQGWIAHLEMLKRNYEHKQQAAGADRASGAAASTTPSSVPGSIGSQKDVETSTEGVKLATMQKRAHALRQQRHWNKQKGNHTKVAAIDTELETVNAAIAAERKKLRSVFLKEQTTKLDGLCATYEDVRQRMDDVFIGLEAVTRTALRQVEDGDDDD